MNKINNGLSFEKYCKDNRVAFCFKLWIKEMLELKRKNECQQYVINMALNEILDGSYCSDEEYEKRDELKLFSQINDLVDGGIKDD